MKYAQYLTLQKPIKPADDDTLFRPVGEYFANLSSSLDTFSEEIYSTGYSTGRLFFLYFKNPDNLDGGFVPNLPEIDRNYYKRLILKSIIGVADGS